MNWINKSLKHVAVSWRNHFAVQTTTLVVLTATFTILVVFLSISNSLNRVLDRWGKGLQVSVFVKDGTTSEERDKLQGILSNFSEFDFVSYVSPESAREEFKEKLKEMAPEAAEDPYFTSSVPGRFDLRLISENVIDRLPQLAEGLRQLVGVEEVTYGEDWVKNYASVVSGFDRGLSILGLILIVASLLVVGNSIRANVATRRDEVEVLELVGASRTMIRTPYVAEGALLGSLAGSLALVLGFVVQGSLQGLVSTHFAFLRLEDLVTFLSPGWCLTIVLAGFTVGALGSYVSIRGLNTGWSSRERLDV